VTQLLTEWVHATGTSLGRIGIGVAAALAVFRVDQIWRMWPIERFTIEEKQVYVVRYS